MLEKELHNKIQYEDTLTSSVIGLLKYLPSEILWHILKSACCNGSNLPNFSGDLIKCEFWPHWNADKTTNTNFVEPDVFMQFSEFDLIIEAKRYDSGGQYLKQWENQIQAYNNINSNKKVYYIALGGNADKVNKSINIKFGNQTISCIINTCNWLGLLVAVAEKLKHLENKDNQNLNKSAMIFILTDIIRAFNHLGIYQIDWFENMFNYEIDYVTINKLEDGK